MSDSEIERRIHALESALGGKDHYEPSKLRRARAEADAVEKAQSDYLRTPAALEIRELGARVQKLENFNGQLRGEEGIDNEGPIFRLTNPRRDMGDTGLDGWDEIDLIFCDENDVQHTGTFLVKTGSVVPPL